MERSEAENMVRNAAMALAIRMESDAQALRDAIVVLDANDPRDALLKEAREVLVELLAQIGSALPDAHNELPSERKAKALLAKLKESPDGPRDGKDGK